MQSQTTRPDRSPKSRGGILALTAAQRCSLGVARSAIMLATSVLLMVACGGGEEADDAVAEGTHHDKTVQQAKPTVNSGQWSPVLPLSLTPMAVSNLPDGRVLMWAGSGTVSFGLNGGLTRTAVFDPSTGRDGGVLTVQSTGHEAFCPGTTLLPDGRLFITGGSDPTKTSVFDARSGNWSNGAELKTARAYHAQTLLADGSVFAYGGSWHGGLGNKGGELWTPEGGWRTLSGVPMRSTAMGPDPGGVFRADNHMWLIPTGNGKILHAGPSAEMHWIDTQGNGSIVSAGPRGDDAYAQSGNTVMFDAGKILKTGGAPAYDGGVATRNSYVIDTNAGLSVRRVADMAYPRVFSNAVVLPNGQVFVVGGQTVGAGWTDTNSVLAPEIWDPKTESFTVVKAMKRGRNYHATALLLPDARVFVGGQGGCGGTAPGCDEHSDAEIFSPHYLFTSSGAPAVRPRIVKAPAAAVHGSTLSVQTDSVVTQFSLVRLSAVTHTVNNDQRRVALRVVANGGTEYQVSLPDNPGILLPGYYMLFAMNAAGVPSVAHTLQVHGQGAPVLRNPGDQQSVVGEAVNVALRLTNSPAGVNFSAAGLPPGLAIDSATGVVTGSPGAAGRYAVTLTARNGVTSSSTDLVWTVSPGDAEAGPQAVSWVRLEVLSEINDNPMASMAEFNLLGADGRALSRAGWRVSASSAEAGFGAAAAIDGNAATIWHTQFVGATPRHPYTFTVRLPAPTVVTGMRILPRQDGIPNGTIGDWRVSTSVDGRTWTRVGHGSLANYADMAARRTGALRQAAWVRLESAGEVNGYPWASMAEFSLLGAGGATLSREGWTAEASSEEVGGAAAYAIDGNPSTIWHTEFISTLPVHPHRFTVKLPSTQSIAGFRYLPRQDNNSNGRLRAWRFWTSLDGRNWQPAGEGNFSVSDEMGGERIQFLDERTEFFHEAAAGRRAAQSSTWQGVEAGPALAVDGVLTNLTHTGNTPQANEWWQVDLGAQRSITNVRLWNRMDCCSERLAGFYVLVSAHDMTGRSLAQLLADPSVRRTWHPLAAPADQLTFPVYTSGRYVRVQLSQPNFLSLREVQVFTTGISVPKKPMVSAPNSVQLYANQAASVSVSGSTLDGSSLRWSASGLPPGLVINPLSGSITGVPKTPGNHTVTITATASNGPQASVNMALQVVPVGVHVPRAPTVAAGATASYRLEGGTFAPGTRFIWDFGDGSSPSTTTRPDASHRYAVGGVFEVKVRVERPDGSAATTRFFQAVFNPATAVAPTSSSQLAWQPRSGASALLWVVNPDQNTVSAIDPSTGTKVAEVPVGTAPRSVARSPGNGRLWVSNGASADLSVIDPNARSVVSTVALPRASQPHGVVFAPNGSAAYVALGATGEVLRLDPISGAVRARVNVGQDVRHLAVSSDGKRLLASRFITPPQPGEGTLVVGTADVGGEVLVLDAVSLARQATMLLKHSQRVDSETQGRGVPNYLGAPVISPDGRSAWVPSKQDNILRGTARDPQRLNLDFQNTVRAVSSRIDMASLTEVTAARVDHDNASVATAAAFHPNGAYLFVALETSREVAVLDAARQRELFRVVVGRAPQAVSVSPDGLQLWVHNFMDRSVTLHDLAPLLQRGDRRVPHIKTVRTIGAERLDATVLRGKQLFYDARDPRLARLNYMSCASCHSDGDHDGRTWDFTGFGEGLRNTPSLRGRAGLANGFAHWSANFDEIQDFEGQIRQLAGGTGLMADADFRAGTRAQPLGDPKAGRSRDLDALAAYVTSLTSFDSSPHRNAEGALTAAAQAGRQVFVSHCASCHGGPGFSGSVQGPQLANIGTIKASSGRRLGGPLTGIDVPTLRDVWATAPYLHDGSAPTLEAAVKAHNTHRLDAQAVSQVVAYLRQIGGEEAQPAGNVALGKRATQSSLSHNGTPSLAVDGNTNGKHAAGSVSHTHYEVQPWWQVDLGQQVYVDSVQLWNRTDCCAERLSNAVLFVSASDMTGRTLAQLNADASVAKVPFDSLRGSDSLTLRVPAAGRFVRVQLAGAQPEYLSLAEVQVFARPLINLARGKAAKQSSLYHPAVAGRAVDGNTNGNFASASVSHTNQEVQPWWQVDLGEQATVHTVRLWNRTDCCADRLSNGVVFVSAADMSGRTLAQLNADMSVAKVPFDSLHGAASLALRFPASGRFVRVQLVSPRSEYLNLAEVQVFGLPNN